MILQSFSISCFSASSHGGISHWRLQSLELPGCRRQKFMLTDLLAILLLHLLSFPLSVAI